MGAARKLQAEIDRTLKKVQEGIVEFDQIWEKVYETESQSQREKYEGDLKKEIKKLQRLRDQIKTWIAGSEVKDKTALMDARKNIEKEMERFKHCEKEAKTKAFSKAGLGQATKLDPEEKARLGAREWLNEQVEALQMQIDEFEAELEGINGTKRGKKPSARQQSLEEWVVRHKSHIARLEQCMRCLDNDTITHDDIDELKDMVEWYVADYENEDAGFETVDDTYAVLIDRLNDVTLGLQTTHIPAKAKKSNDLEEEMAEREREKERAAAAAVKAQLLSSHGSNAATLLEEEKKTPAVARTVPISANASQTTMKRRVSMSEVPSGNHIVDELMPVEGTSPTAKSTGVVSSVKSEAANGALTFASAAAGRNNVTPPAQRTTTWETTKGEDGEYPKLTGVAAAAAGMAEKSKSLDLVAPESKVSPKRMSLDTSTVLGGTPVGAPVPAPVPKTVTTGTSSSLHSSPAVTTPTTDATQLSLQSHDGSSSRGNHVTMDKAMGFKAAVLSGGTLGASSSAAPVGNPELYSADASAHQTNDPMLTALNVNDLIDSLSMSCAEVSTVPLMPSQFEGNAAASMQLLEACSRRSMPQPVDRDYKTQLSQNTSRGLAQQLPSSFPIHRLPQLEDPNFYQKLDIEVLFYAFYFLPGDIAQYCAAKELKRQSWRYHMQHNAWFQRAGERKASTNDYEEGGYIYFDKSISGNSLLGDSDSLTNGWCCRKEDNFVFHYDQLEDELR